MATIAVLGTLDSKGHEHAFVADVIRRRGHTPLLVDVGVLDEPQVRPDVTREEVVAAAGGVGADWAALRARRDRGESVAAMAAAAPAFLARLAADGRVAGVIALGGGGGTAIATAAMRALPVGFPKVMVSTLASGNVAAYVGTTDLAMFPSIVDVSGLNRISRLLFTRAAGAICGMVESEPPPPTEAEKPIVVASMFGNTTACVNHAKRVLEAAGYEVLVFHATGVGGRTMESLVESGLVAGVLDVTTTEWADELVGGILGAGRARLDAAARARVPAVVAPGCLDMVNFGEPASVPQRFKGRRFYPHNPQVTLMRTTPAECAELGRILAEKVNAYTAPVTVMLPTRAVSVVSAAGGPFHDAEADAALFGAIRAHLRPGVRVVELDHEVNDPAFADACAAELLKNMGWTARGTAATQPARV
jgi:uncharacterized protein (UPF0261 family)